MQSLAGINLPAAQLTAPPKAHNFSGEDKFAPALKQATKDKKGSDDLAGAASVSAQHDLNRELEGKAAEGKAVAGETVAGETVAGETVAGETVAGETVAGETVAGETVAGEAVAGEAVAGEAAVNVAPDEVTGIGASDSAATVNGLVKNSKVPSIEGRTVVGTQDGKAVSEHNGAADKGLVVENLSKGAAIEVEVQNRLKGAALKTEVMAGAGSEARPILAEAAAKQQLNVVAAAVKPEILQDSAVVVQQVGNGLIASDKNINGKAKVITDPRFATLLNKPELPVTLRQQQVEAGTNLTNGGADNNSAEALFGGLSVSDSVKLSVATDPTLVTQGEFGATLAAGEGLAQMKFTSADTPPKGAEIFNVQGGTPTPHTVNSVPEPVMLLKDGSMLPESRVVQQTIDHLSIHARGDSSTVTIKLHPEELGELQLRLVMEGDKLRVHLQTQNQQVQEVLERNFPRLRDALQEAGVNVSDFQVSSDAGERGNQQNFAQNEFLHSNGPGQLSGFAEDEIDTLGSVIAATAVAPGDSLSVRV